MVDLSHVRGAITLEDLRHAGYGVETTRLLVHTGRTVAHGEFPPSWPALDPQAARTIARAGLRLFGVDCPSVDDRESKALEVHHAMFDGGAHVLENLDLRGITPGRWELVALPLRWGAGRGAGAGVPTAARMSVGQTRCKMAISASIKVDQATNIQR